MTAPSRCARAGAAEMVHPARGPRPRVLAVTAVVAAACGLGSITPEQVRCEEALAEVASCCPGLDPALFRCDEAGCNPSPRSFEPDEAECVLAASCDDFRRKRWCEALAARAGADTAADAGTASRKLCP